MSTHVRLKWKRTNIGQTKKSCFFLTEYKCLYSPWVDLDPCAMTCINGYKIQVRTVGLVLKDTPGAEDCTEDLIQKVNCSSPTCK